MTVAQVDNPEKGHISELIKKLPSIVEKHGDIKLKIFHHEGGNSLRGYPEELQDYTLEVKKEKDGNLVLYIGGWYP